MCVKGASPFRLLKSNKDLKHLVPECVSGEDNINDDSVDDDADGFVDVDT